MTETDLTALEERLHHLETFVLNQQYETSSDLNEDDTEEEYTLIYKTADIFVEHYVKEMLETRQPQKLYWCDNWRDHPRSMRTFILLWKNLEQAKATDTATTGGEAEISYLVYHFYPLVEKLLSVDGPHKNCETKCAGTTIEYDQNN